GDLGNEQVQARVARVTGAQVIEVGRRRKEIRWRIDLSKRDTCTSRHRFCNAAVGVIVLLFMCDDQGVSLDACALKQEEEQARVESAAEQQRTWVAKGSIGADILFQRGQKVV